MAMDYQRLRKEVFNELPRCHFGTEDRPILDLVFRLSLLEEREFTPPLMQKEICFLTGLDKGAVSRTLRRLVRTFQVLIVRNDCYTFRFPASAWRAPLGCPLDLEAWSSAVAELLKAIAPFETGPESPAPVQRTLGEPVGPGPDLSDGLR